VIYFEKGADFIGLFLLNVFVLYEGRSFSVGMMKAFLLLLYKKLQ